MRATTWPSRTEHEATVLTRAARLAALGTRIAELAPELEELACRVLPFPRSVIRADVDLAARRMHAMAECGTAVRDRRPVGTVALALPGNAILSNPTAAIGAAYLTGNDTVARLPRTRSRWAARLTELLAETLPGAPVRIATAGGREFIERALDDPVTRVLAVFGDDTWAMGYEDLVRRTGTTFVFEGPGKDPFLVLDPVLAEEAAAAAVRACCYNAGQACTAPERFYVVADAHDEFVGHAVAAVRRLRTGPHDSPLTQIGGLAPQVAATVLRQVDEAAALGATVHGDPRPREFVVAGERRVQLAPVVLTGVDQRMSVLREETFGPVLPVCRVDSAATAVALAEDSRYGLTATVYGGDAAVTERLARTHGQVFSATTWLDHRVARPTAPYGGRRASGWVWSWRGDQFVRRDGPRDTLHEFSRPADE